MAPGLAPGYPSIFRKVFQRPTQGSRLDQTIRDMYIKQFFLLLFFGASLLAEAQTDRTRFYASGDTLPDLLLTQLDFTTLRTDSAYANKGMVIIFYKGLWSKPCMEQIHEIEAYRKELAQRGYVVLAITTQPVELMKGMQETERFKVPVLQDENAVAITKLGIGQAFIPIPTIMVVDKQHIIRYIYTNSNASIRANSDDIVEQVRMLSPLP